MEPEEKKVSLVKTILFTICSILVLDSLAAAGCYWSITGFLPTE